MKDEDSLIMKLDVNYEGNYSYTIMLEKSFDKLTAFSEVLDTKDRRVLIVTDSNVAPLYLNEVRSRLETCFREVYTLILTPGEEHKNTDSVAEIYQMAVQYSFDRKDFFAALGGGVIGDMTGFAAATYMRGIRFIQIPTTLLSQVDSSIGGKTGVDFRAYKNMVGAFHMPSWVYSNIHTLQTLDDVQYASGMGEVIKHALIRDRNYFDFLLENREKLHVRDEDTLLETVHVSNQIKRAVVEADPKEKGERQLLNFGHTLGHAIEKCALFRLSHGQCVALGCLLAIRISNTLSDTTYQQITALMKECGLETEYKELDIEEIIAATKKDKKMDNGQVRFILLHALGDAYIDKTVSDDRMREALQELLKGKL